MSYDYVIPYNAAVKLKQFSSGKINIISIPKCDEKEIAKKIANEVEKHFGFCFSMAMNTCEELNDR